MLRKAHDARAVDIVPTPSALGLCLAVSTLVLACVTLSHGYPQPNLVTAALLVVALGVGGLFVLCLRQGVSRVLAHLYLIGMLSAGLLVAQRMPGFSVMLGILVPVLAAFLLGRRGVIGWAVASFCLVGYAGPELQFQGLAQSSVALAALSVVLLVSLFSLLTTEHFASETARGNAAVPQSPESQLSGIIDTLFPSTLRMRGANILNPSENLCELLGLSRSQLQGQTLLSYAHPSDVGTLTQLLPPPQGQSVRLRLRGADGQWLSFQGFVLSDLDRVDKKINAQLARSAGVVQTDETSESNTSDLTPLVDRDWVLILHPAEEEVEVKTIQQERLQGTGVLASGVAHDFSNLLTVIGGVAELMDDSEARGLILEASRDAANLVQKLMDFGQGGGNTLASCDANQVLGGMRFRLRNLVGATIEMQMVLGLSASQLNQVVVNLVTNAREHMPRGGRIEIELIAHGTGDKAKHVVRVCDDGMGMSAETIEYAFDPFFSTKPSTAGAGLGLSSVYGIVHHAGGRVEIDSAPNQGCRVSLHLPDVSARTVDDTQQKHRPVAGDATVLVVEDEEIIADLVARNLVNAGYHVTIKNDIESAWAHLMMGLPDILVTDIMMPDGRGTDLARRLRDEAVQIPILFISGYADEQISDWRRAGGQISFLAKPFRGQELLDRVSELISGGQEVG